MRGMGKFLVVLVLLLGSCVTASPAPHGKVALNPTYLSETLSLATTGNSTVQRTSGIFLVGVSVSTTGTATGTWTIQYSNDNVTWDTYNPSGFSAPPAAAGAPQVFAVVLDNWEFAFFRILYTRTSGTGTATIVTLLK